MIDKERQALVKKDAKRKSVHPYGQIQHRIVDSTAFADLKPSSCRLLMILLRQITSGNNNGHLQATFTYCKKRGFGSETTLREAIADLIKHGFIHRTRSRGPNKQWAKYALTCFPIKDKKGLFLHAWNPDGWRDWEKNNTPQIPTEMSGRNCWIHPQNLESTTETDGARVPKSDDYEVLPFIGARRSPGNRPDPISGRSEQ
jgi:hypothetical protein